MYIWTYGPTDLWLVGFLPRFDSLQRKGRSMLLGSMVIVLQHLDEKEVIIEYRKLSPIIMDRPISPRILRKHFFQQCVIYIYIICIHTCIKRCIDLISILM